MKVHILSDSPKVKSGFSIVSENIAIGLQKLGYEVTMTGIQTIYSPEYLNGTIKVFPLVSNQLEESQYISNLTSLEPDVVLYVGDMYTDVSYLAKTPILNKICKKCIVYCPVEGSKIPRRMVKDLNDIANSGGKIVAQCKYGFEEMKKCNVNVDRYIYHGFKPDIFHTNFTKGDINKLEEKTGITETVSFAKFNNGTKEWNQILMYPVSKLPEYFKNKFVFIFVGANHSVRKRIERLLKAYSILIKDNRQLKDRTLLHLHTQPISGTGLNLIDIANDLDIQDNISFTYNSTSVLSDESISFMYNISDCFVSATSSEGFSLPHLEAMACGLPCVSPNCTSMTELIGHTIVNNKSNLNNVRGLLARVESNFMMIDGSVRSLVDENDLAICMKDMYTDDTLRKKMSKNCAEFTSNYTWDKICDEWDNLFKNIKM